jgi:hypothetical protein
MKTKDQILFNQIDLLRIIVIKDQILFSVMITKIMIVVIMIIEIQN